MSSDEEAPVVRRLRSGAREEGAEECSPWSKLAAGELSAEEEAALRKEAALSEEGRALLALYEPFDEDEKRQFFEGVRSRIQADRRRQRRRIAAAIAIALMVIAAAAVTSRYLQGRRRAPASSWITVSASSQRSGSSPTGSRSAPTTGVEVAARRLVEAACNAGGLDNATAIILRNANDDAPVARAGPTP